MAFESIDRMALGHMLEMWDRTSSAPWKATWLEAAGMRPDDAAFVVMVHARFKDIANTILAGHTLREIVDKERAEQEVANGNKMAESLASEDVATKTKNRPTKQPK